jgi:putative OPT family oligopeptide transporter
MGTVLGVVFGASSLYLVLKVGLTVSASIPVAVISITLFRLLSKLGIRDATVLENNIVQTAGSAGESIAFGIGVTMPAILILGFDLELTRVMLVAVLGGLLGILMMIPLRRALIVAQHGYLKYPEGTACAEVLKAGASDESRAAAAVGAQTTGIVDEATTGGKTIMAGFGIGFLYYGIQEIWKTWKEYPTKVFGKPFEAGSVSIENNPALLGVGYIIGPRISSIMAAGGVLSYLVLIPAIKFFGSGLVAPLAPETAHLIKDMSVSQIQKAYVLYIGAGAVAAGGIISLIRSLPVIWSGLKGGLADLRRTKTAVAGAPRTDQDLSMKFVLGGIIALLLAIMIAPQLNLRGNLVGAVLIVAFGFLFVTVSSRLTGEIGSSSNPISGMTVATLYGTAVFRHSAVDRRHRLYRGIEWRHNFSRFEDRFSRRFDAEISANRHTGRGACFRRCAGTDFAGNESIGHCLCSRRAEQRLQFSCRISLHTRPVFEKRRPAEARQFERLSGGRRLRFVLRRS